MRRNSVTPLASPEPTKKPRINSFEEHVASTSAALPSCLPPEVPTQLPGQVSDSALITSYREECAGETSPDLGLCLYLQVRMCACV